MECYLRIRHTMHISSTYIRLLQFLCIMLIGSGFEACTTTPSITRRVITPRQFSFQPDSSLAFKRAKDFMIRGSVLQMQELYAEAILEYQLALRYDSSEVILYAIGKSYARLNKNELALEYARAAYRKDSSSVPTILLLAEVLEKMDESEEEIALYERLVELEPWNTEHKFGLAQLTHYKDPERSIELYRQILNVEEDEATMWFLAQAYRNARNYDMYVTTLERLYSVTSDSRVSNILVQAYLRRKTFEPALTLLQKLEVTDDQDSYHELCMSLAEELLDQEDSTLSHLASLHDHLLRISEQQNSSSQFQYMHGMLAYRTGDSLLAATFFLAADRYSDSTPELSLRLGSFYVQRQNFQRAIDVLQIAAARFPAETAIHLYLGIAYATVNRYPEAIARLHTAVSLDSLNFDAWTQLGIVYDRQQLSDSSDHAYEKALGINETSPLVNNNYAYSLSVRKAKLPLALSMAEKAIQAQPYNASFLDTYAWVHYQLGNYEQAREFLEKAVRTGEPSATIYEHLGDTYSKLGIDSKAMEAYTNALKKSPDRTSVKERLRNLSK